jgi:small subunit ribosomal protein S16
MESTPEILCRHLVREGPAVETDRVICQNYLDLKFFIRRGGVLLRIRLTRIGAKKKPFYRVVVMEQRSNRDGSFVEILGHYNPKTNPPLVELKMDRVRHWLACGAQPSDTVGSLLKKAAPPAVAAS